MSEYQLRAWAWWNTAAGCAGDYNAPPELVVPATAQDIWSRLLPVFLVFVVDEDHIETYWRDVAKVVLKFDHREVPDPIARFPEFIARIYSMRDLLVPKSVEAAVPLVDRFGFHDTGHFVLYQLPMFLHHPLVYWETLAHLRQRHHHVWMGFVSDQHLPPALFQLAAGFVGPPLGNGSRHLWRHRGAVMEVLFYAILDSPVEANVLIADWMNMAGSLLAARPPSTVQVTITRAGLSLCLRLGSDTAQRSAADDMFMTLIAELHGIDSIMLIPALQLGLQQRSVDRAVLLKVVAETGIRGLGDIEMIRAGVEPRTAADAIRLLVGASPVWYRAAQSVALDIMSRFGSRTDVREFVGSVVRRCFVFVHLAFGAGKYRGRAMMVLESLLRMASSGVTWLINVIRPVAWTVSTRGSPFLRPLFGAQSGALDERASRELDQSFGVRLKGYALYSRLEDAGKIRVRPSGTSVGRHRRAGVRVVRKSASTSVRFGATGPRELGSLSSPGGRLKTVRLG